MIALCSRIGWSTDGSKMCLCSSQLSLVRKKSGKPSGGQAGHRGQSLQFSSASDEVIVQAVERCQQCQADLHTVRTEAIERRQVVDIPVPRVLVREYRSEQKQCPHCQHLTVAPFPQGVR